jgi:hypothetical protein
MDARRGGQKLELRRYSDALRSYLFVSVALNGAWDALLRLSDLFMVPV